MIGVVCFLWELRGGTKVLFFWDKINRGKWGSIFIFALMTILSTTFKRFLVCFLVFFVNFTIAQDYSQRYLISDGLPSQEIYDLHQDKNGLLWIASDRGIASFNGTEFTPYGMIDGIPSNMVFEFFEQEDGSIWCTTRECQLFYFHPDTLKFHLYKYNNELFTLFEKYQKLEPRELVVNRDGSVKFRLLWQPGTVSVSANGTMYFEYVEKNKIGNRQSQTVKRDDSGYPSLHYANSLNESELKGFGKGMRNHLLDLDSSYVRLSEYGYQILEKKNLHLKEYVYFGEAATILNAGKCPGGFWIGKIHDGVKVLDESGKVKKHIGREYSITSYLEDADGGVWLGTHGSGLLYYAKSKLKVYHPSLHIDVMSLSRDADNNLLYITNHRNVVTVDRHLNQVSSEKVDWNKVLGQYYSWDDQFYDVTSERLSDIGRIVRYSDNREKPPLFVYGSEVQDVHQNLVFSTKGTGHRLADAEHMGENIVIGHHKSILLIDKKGNILASKDLDATINDVDVSEDGLIYCGTRWKGVFVLNQKLQLVSRINTTTGAPGNYVFELLEDGNVLWIGTDNGLCKATKRSEGRWKCESLGLPEGLPDVQLYDIEKIGGRIYLATREGICYFEKKDWKNIVQRETRIYFEKTKFIVNGQQRDNLLNLSHDENQVEIRFELVNFANTRKLNFRYKLKGFDDTWQVTSERRVLYHSLPPGNYEFIVQPVINENPRGKILREKIEIYPAFYNRWWFHIALWSIVILIIWLFFKYRILNYNRGVIQEILRQLSRRLRPETNQFIVRCNGRDVRIVSEEVVYVESSRNYITIYTEDTRYIIRQKISDFTSMVPDPLEYTRLKRSLIIRIDKVTEKGVNTVVIGGKEFKVGKTYLENLKKIEL